MEGLTEAHIKRLLFSGKQHFETAALKVYSIKTLATFQTRSISSPDHKLFLPFVHSFSRGLLVSCIRYLVDTACDVVRWIIHNKQFYRRVFLWRKMQGTSLTATCVRTSKNSTERKKLKRDNLSSFRKRAICCEIILNIHHNYFLKARPLLRKGHGNRKCQKNVVGLKAHMLIRRRYWLNSLNDFAPMPHADKSLFCSFRFCCDSTDEQTLLGKKWELSRRWHFDHKKKKKRK